MRSDNLKWMPTSVQERPTLTADGIQIEMVSLKRQTLLSGPISHALNAAGQKVAVGWPDVASSDSYALRLRRDRILLVGGPNMTDGWHDDIGLAISNVSNAYSVIELSGKRAFQLLQRGTEISRGETSSSVVRLYSGYATLIYGYHASDRWRMHVPRAFLDGLWDLVTTYCDE